MLVAVHIRRTGGPDDSDDANRPGGSGRSGDSNRPDADHDFDRNDDDDWVDEGAPLVVGPVTPPVIYRVPARVIQLKFGLAAAVAVAALFPREPALVAFALVVAAALTIYSVHDVVARQRLRIEADGLVVAHGYAGQLRLGWADIERIKVDERLRFGARARLLEIDAGAWIGLFSRFELGADPELVAATIDAVRSQAGPSSS